MPILSHFSAFLCLASAAWPSLLEQLPPKETEELGGGTEMVQSMGHPVRTVLIFHFTSHSAELYQLPCSLQCLSPYNLSAVAASEWNEQQMLRSFPNASTEIIPSVIYYLSRRAPLKSAMQIRRPIPLHTQSAEWIWSQTAEDTCRGGQKTVRVLPREIDMAAE